MLKSELVAKLSLLLIVIVGYAYGASQSALQTHVSTFVIEPGTKNKISVQLVAESVSATCKLEYDTTVVEEKTITKDWTPADILIGQISRKYKCLDTSVGQFSYEICLGDEIKQKEVHDAYSLGKYEKVIEGAAYTQLYTKGTFCDASHSERKSVVEFACANTASIMNFFENAVCQYRFIVGVPEVCGHPQFSRSDNKPETWVLELTETDEGGVICQAYNNGYDSIGTLTFQAFDLSISTADYSLTNYVFRDNKRKAVANVDLQRQKSPAGVAIRKREQLDYAKIVAE